MNKIVHTPPPFGYTTFCDDIRQEQGNKRSLIGVYTSKLTIHGKFPSALPKLCAAITFKARKSDIAKFGEKLVFRLRFQPVDLDQEITDLVEFEVDRDAISKGLKSAAGGPMPADLSEKDRMATTTFNAVMSPFEVSRRGFLRVSVASKETEWQIGTLLIDATGEEPLQDV